MTTFDDLETAQAESLDWTLLDAAKYMAQVHTNDSRFWEKEWALAKLTQTIETAEAAA